MLHSYEMAAIGAVVAILALSAIAIWYFQRKKILPPGSGFASFFKRHPVLDDETRQALRELLISADFGPTAADDIIAAAAVNAKAGADADTLMLALRDAIAAALKNRVGDPDQVPSGGVLVFVGTNGSGKTTSIAKISQRWRQQGRKIVLGAADTFRAAAADQLQMWGERVQARVVRQAPGADPAAVAFDTIKAAEADGATAIIDTAGCTHVDAGLMNELIKVIRVIGKAREGAPDAIWLTLDTSQGQTAVEQARKFAAAVPVSGLLLNKIDGEGRGGFALTITRELNLPIVGLGCGEGLDDFEPFDPVRYAERVVFGVRSRT